MNAGISANTQTFLSPSRTTTIDQIGPLSLFLSYVAKGNTQQLWQGLDDQMSIMTATPIGLYVPGVSRAINHADCFLGVLAKTRGTGHKAHARKSPAATPPGQ